MLVHRYDNGNIQVLSPNFTKTQVLSSAPNTTAVGYMYYDTTKGLGVYYGGQFNYASGGGGIIGSTVKVTGVVASSGTFITGSTTYTNAAMSGLPVLLFRNKLMEPDTNPGTGDSYFTKSGSTITFSSALTAGELIQIIILPA